MEEKKRPVRTLLCVLFLFMTLTGSWMLFTEYTRAHYPAVIVSAGKITSTTSRSRRRSSSRTTYRMDAKVAYTEDGSEKTGEVSVSFTNRWWPPKKGDTVEVGPGITGGLTTYPDNRTRRQAWALTVSGGIFLAVTLFSVRSSRRKEWEKVRAWREGETEAGPAAEGQAPGTPVITDRVVRQEDGSYRWICEMDEEYQRENNERAVKIFWLIAAGMVGIGVILAVAMNAWMALWILVATAAFFMGITLIVTRIVTKLPGSRTERYEIREDGVKTGYGKYSVYLSWDNLTRVRWEDRYVELKGKLRTIRIYVPGGDMPAVREAILRWMPSGTETEGNPGSGI